MIDPSEIAQHLSRSPERSLVYELFQMVADLSWSNPHLMLLASTLPDSEVESVATEYRSAVTSSPLYSTAQDRLFLRLTMMLRESERLKDLFGAYISGHGP